MVLISMHVGVGGSVVLVLVLVVLHLRGAVVVALSVRVHVRLAVGVGVLVLSVLFGHVDFLPRAALRRSATSAPRHEDERHRFSGRTATDH